MNFDINNCDHLLKLCRLYKINSISLSQSSVQLLFVESNVWRR